MWHCLKKTLPTVPFADLRPRLFSKKRPRIITTTWAQIVGHRPILSSQRYINGYGKSFNSIVLGFTRYFSVWACASRVRFCTIVMKAWIGRVQTIYYSHCNPHLRFDSLITASSTWTTDQSVTGYIAPLTGGEHRCSSCEVSLRIIVLGDNCSTILQLQRAKVIAILLGSIGRG